MGFWLKAKKSGKKRFCWETRYSKESITFPEPKDRLFKHLSEYSLSTFYGVRRTDFLRMIFGELMIYGELFNSKADLADTVGWSELLPSMLDVIYGKTECLDVFYMARRDSRSDYWPISRPTSIYSMNQGRYDAEYAKFRQCLSTHLSKNSQLNIEESKKVIDDAMSQYIKKYYSNSTGFRQALRDKANHNQTFDKLYKCARFIYRLARLVKKLVRRSYLKRNFLPEYRDDFEKIKNQVIKSEF